MFTICREVRGKATGRQIGQEKDKETDRGKDSGSTKPVTHLLYLVTFIRIESKEFTFSLTHNAMNRSNVFIADAMSQILTKSQFDELHCINLIDYS